MRIGYRKRKVDASSDALIGSRVPKYLAVEDGGAGSHLHPNHPRVKRDNRKEQSQEKQPCRRPQAHAGKHSMQPQKSDVFITFCSIYA
jgi:hypothetical protein